MFGFMIIWFFSLFFLPRDLDLLEISWLIGSFYIWLNLLWLLRGLFLIILLFLNPLLDLDWSPFRLIVPGPLGLVELSILYWFFSLSISSYSSSAAVLKPLKNGCINAYLAEKRSLGSICRSPLIISSPSFVSFD